MRIGGAWRGVIGRAQAVQHTFAREKWNNEAALSGRDGRLGRYCTLGCEGQCHGRQGCDREDALAMLI